MPTAGAETSSFYSSENNIWDSFEKQFLDYD